MKSLDHLVRAVQHVRRNRQTDQFGGIQIYNELKLHGLLHGKIGWLGTFQDSIHVVSGRHSKFVGLRDDKEAREVCGRVKKSR
jgi:hypothetical protein